MNSGYFLRCVLLHLIFLYVLPIVRMPDEILDVDLSICNYEMVECFERRIACV